MITPNLQTKFDICSNIRKDLNKIRCKDFNDISISYYLRLFYLISFLLFYSFHPMNHDPIIIKLKKDQVNYKKLN